MIDMQRHSFTRRTVILIVIAFVLVLAGLFFVSASDPLVDYYGNVMRQSVLRDQMRSSLYCQQLASFSFGPNFACFDSKQELDEFAAGM